MPVDTHVWQIAQRDYKMGKTKTKTFNKIMYEAVGDHFRGIWGEYAGWAQSVVFTAKISEAGSRAIKKEEDPDAELVSVDITPNKRSRVKVEVTSEEVKIEPGRDTEVRRTTKRRKI